MCHSGSEWLQCEKTGAKDESYDLVIANHVLFYCKNVNKALDEIVRC